VTGVQTCALPISGEHVQTIGDIECIICGWLMIRLMEVHKSRSRQMRL